MVLANQASERAVTPLSSPASDLAGSSGAETEKFGDGSVSIPRLLLLFLWIGSISVGGWTMPYFFDEMVRRRRWLTAERFVEIDMLSRLLPGAKGPNVAIFLVQALRGPLVAALCLIVFVLPGTLLILLASHVLFGSEQPAWLTGSLRGLYLAALALIISSCVRMLSSVRGARFGATLAGLAFLAGGLLGLDLLLVVLLLGSLSLLLNRPER